MWGNVEDGDLPCWCLNLSIAPSFITLKRNGTGLQQSITENMQAHTVLPALQNWCFFTECPYIHQTDPFPSPTCMLMGSLNMRGRPDQDKNPNLSRLKCTILVADFDFDITTVLFSVFALVQCYQLVFRVCLLKFKSFLPHTNWSLHLIWCQVALVIQRTQCYFPLRSDKCASHFLLTALCNNN